MTPSDIIAALNLSPLPHEGGHFRETYRSPLFVSANSSAPHSASTAIYFFLTADEHSNLHRLTSDEVYHFYRGDPVELTLFTDAGDRQTIILGPAFETGQHPQYCVPAGLWQSARLLSGGAWALLGTTVAPAFDWQGFELADDELVRRCFRDGHSIR